MSSVFDRAVPRRHPESKVSKPEEQVPFWLADRRLVRREEARKRAKIRTGGRGET